MKVSRPAKRLSTASKDVLALIKKIETCPTSDLADLLKEIQFWRYPRGDFQAWIPVLDKFDAFFEETIKSYELSKIQTNDFTPKTKETLLEVLRFIRLLLDNCTQRKLFSSYDRLYDLLLTNDVDVLISSLLVLLRPAQQYGPHTPFEPGFGTKIRQRLNTVFRSWDVFRVGGHDLSKLATSESLDFDDTFYNIQSTFYPAKQAGPSSPSTPKRRKTVQGVVTVELGDIRSYDHSCLPDRLATLADQHDMPLEEQYSLYNKIRLAMSSNDLALRQNLLTARLLSLACLVSLSHEESAQSSVFLYEPDLITQIAQLLPSRSCDLVLSAAASALDSCARHRNKTQEVLTAVGFNTSHGPLMTLCRSTVQRMLKGDNFPAPETVDSLFSLLAYIIADQGLGNGLISGGLFPVLLDILKVTHPRRENYIPRAAGLIDTSMMSGPNTMQTLNAADGVSILVTSIKSEVASMLESIPQEPSETMSEENLLAAISAPLKGMLRSIHRLMANFGGTEGMRTLVDSELPKCLKTIFEHSAKFGNKACSIAINTMAAFINNEPTSLTILQDLKLPQALYATLEEAVPPSFDIMPSIPNAIGAICLNETGMNFTKEHPKVIRNLLASAAVTPVDENIYSERDHVQIALGKGLDELVRHHPPLRPTVLDAIIDHLQQAVTQAAAFKPSEEDEKHYVLRPDAAAPPSTDSQSATTNESIETLMRIWKLYTGLLRNGTVCREFMDRGGLDMLSQTTDLPCIPENLRGTDWVMALQEVFKTISDHDHVRVAKHHISRIQKLMADSRILWQSDSATENWILLEKGEADQAHLQAFEHLQSLEINLYLLSSTFMTISFSHSRVVTSLIQAIGAPSSSFISDLGILDRVCYKQYARLKTDDEDTDPTPAALVGMDVDVTMLQKAIGALRVATQLHSMSARLMKSFVKLLFVKRSPDATHRKEAEPLAHAMAEIISADLKDALTESSIRQKAITFGLAGIMLFDDRGLDGHLNASFLVAFTKLEAMDLLRSLASSILDHMDTLKLDENEAGKNDRNDAIVATKMVLLALRALVARKSIEGPQMTALRSQADVEFSLDRYFLQIRLQFAPLTHRVWTAPWLVKCPQPLIKAATRSFLTIMDEKTDEGETRNVLHSHSPAPIPRPRHQPPPPADPARIQQLVDMGFSRGAAEYALQRARNNVAAAADLILSMPHLFAEIPDVPAPTEAAPTEEPVAPGSSGEQADTQEPGTAAEAPTETPAVTSSDGSDEPVESAATAPSDPPAMEVDPKSTEPQVTAESLREDLKKLREEYQPGIPSRAIELVGAAEDLVFDLVSALPEKEDGLKLILETTMNLVKPYAEENAPTIKARLRLTSVFIRNNEPMTLEEPNLSLIQNLITALPLDMTPRPVWISGLLLVIETSYVMAGSIREAKLGEDKPGDIVVPTTLLQGRAEQLMKLCTDILVDEQAPREDLISALRLMVLLTRHDTPSPEILEKVFAPARTPSQRFVGCQPYLAIIARHAVEREQVLQQLMQLEIKQWLSPTRNKVTDVTHFIRQLRQVAARDPTLFVRAIEEQCELVDPTPPQSVYHIRGKEQSTKKDGDLFQDSTGPANAVMAMLLSQLGAAVQDSQKEVTKEEASQQHSYAGFMLSTITELVGSYVPAKLAFRAVIRQQGLYPQSKSTSGLQAFVTDLVCGVDLKEDLTMASNTKRTVESTRRIALSNWSMALLVGLCADVSGMEHPDAAGSEDMVHIRKTVLDVIIKTLKDPGSSDQSSRYARLWAISELIYKLLWAKPTIVSSKDKDESSVYIAKLMLERGVVNMIASAIGEVDLNYPDVKVVLVSALRALECLTKISIKWSKVQKSTEPSGNAAPAHSTDEESLDDSDVDMTSDTDHDAPDLYRNSALGMIGGEIRDDDDESEDEDEEDDDELMGDYDDDDMDDELNDQTDTDDASHMDDEEGDEEGMDEDDWTDEHSDDEEDDEIPEVVLGHETGDEEIEWTDGMALDDGGPMPGPGDPEDFDHNGDEDEDDEDSLTMDEMMDDMNMEMEMAMEDDMEMEMDDEEYDEETGFLEPMSAAAPLGYPDVDSGPSASVSGHWGWDGSGRNSRSDREHRRHSRLMDTDPMASALLGGPRRQIGSGPAQHPMVTESHAPSGSAQRRIVPRNLLTALHDLLTQVTPQAPSEQAHMILERLLSRIGHVGADSLRIRLSPEEDGNIGIAIGDQSYNLGPSDTPSSPEATIDAITADYIPKPTLHRWQDEMTVIPGNSSILSSRLVNHIINRLLPDARKRAEEEAERVRKAEEEAKKQKEADDAKRAEEEAAKKKEEDARKAEEDAKKAEEEAQKAEQDRRDAEAAAATAAAVPLPESRASPVPATDVEMTESAPDTELAPTSAPTSESLARTIIQIRGEDIDITDTGIDLEFLQALPDDMRADVVDQHLREQNRLRQPRNPDAQAAEADSAISAEFLDALPPDIRAEVVMQQAMENARRNVAQEQAAPTLPVPSGPPQMLLDALSSTRLQDIVMGGPSPFGRPSRPTNAPREDPAASTKPAREVVQLLERPGIAALVRLLFFPEVFKKNHLFRVLTNLCANTATRSELLNLLLTVIQEGSGDLPNVDKSFQQMSIKGATTTPKTSKRPAEPTTPGPALNLFAHLQSDNIPTFIAQRCFEALEYIVMSHTPAVMYFLTEHESVGSRKPTSRKGKGKDKALPQTKFPIVILLSLLDRINLLKAPGIMVALTSLLSTITRPLTTIKLPTDDEKKTKDVKPTETAETTVTETDQAPGVATALVTPAPAASASVSAPGAPAATPGPTSAPSSALSTFPLIPAPVLRLVVNCLTIGECSSRNFSQTLVVMQNLSAIPDAKDTILQELVSRCQSTTQDIMAANLLVLRQSLEEGPNSVVDSAALSALSAPSSLQAQLLRMLKTIEYLHLNKVDSDPPGEEMTEQEKALGQMYQSFEFDALWKELAYILTLLRDREDADQIALVLLPLIEALMVVCKYRGQSLREIRSPSLPPSGTTVDVNDLFVSFTTAHRKILNMIVRNNPSLLSGSFSLLIRNPKILEFENKRSWFVQKLRRKRGDMMHSSTLHLNVRRQYVFEDSFQALRQRTGDEIKYGKLSVKFFNEDGIDAGGVQREWFTVLAQQIFNPNFALFEPCAADQQTYQPNKHSSVHELHLAYFKFVGRVIGKAVYDGRLLDAYFNRAFYKQILGRSVDIRDLESIDPEYHKSLQWMLDNDITDTLDMDFTIEDSSFGEQKVVPLKENGASIPVTEENKEEYIRLVVSYRLHNSVKDQLKAFLDGFYEIIPRKLIQIFEPDQLELLISGMSMVDVDELKNATQYAGYKSTDPEIAWFWRALRSFSQEERSRFLMFVTSSSRVPLGGFTQLVGASGIQPFQIQKLYAKPGSLPQASTCFNLLLLPAYDSYEQLREKLVLAVEEGGGFGKA